MPPPRIILAGLQPVTPVHARDILMAAACERPRRLASPLGRFPRPGVHVGRNQGAELTRHLPLTVGSESHDIVCCVACRKKGSLRTPAATGGQCPTHSVLG